MLDPINAIAFYSTFLVPAIAWYNFKNQPSDLKASSVFFIFSALFGLVQYILALNGINNLWAMNLYTLIEGVFFMILLYHLDNSKIFRRVMLFTTVFYVLFWILTTFYNSSFFTFNEKEKTLKGAILIISTCYMLVKYSLNVRSTIHLEYRFWILTAMLFYFTLTIAVFATSRIILSNNHNALFLTWRIHSGINAISNILFFISYICYFRKINSYSHSA